MATKTLQQAPGYEQRTMSGNLSSVRYSTRAQQDGTTVSAPHRGIAVHIPKRNAQGQILADENGEVLRGAEAVTAFEKLEKGSKIEAEGGYVERNAPGAGCIATSTWCASPCASGKP